MEETLNFAIVGCGVIGPTHTRSIIESPGTRLVAVCDIVEERACGLAESYSALVYTHYHELLKRDMISAICEDRQPLVNGVEGRKPLAIVLAIYESAKTGKPVHL